MSTVFDGWNKGELDSFLVEITGDILAYKDTDGKPLVEGFASRHRRPEGYGEVDRHFGFGYGHAGHSYWGGRVCEVFVGD